MLDKHYRHQDIEAKWYRRWEEAGLFHSEPETERPSYTVVIPPPNITGKLHMGHVLNTTVQDIIIRYKQMSGFNTCWVPGTDHAGIATQNMVEKDLRGQGIDPDNLTREEFLEKVWQWREQYGRIIIQQLRTLGASCDWDRECFTMDETRSRAVLTFFKRFYDKGLIYRGNYIVNWCPALQTALSDDEVDRAERPSKLWHFRYPIAGEDGYLVVATTRPETMLGDSGVAVHPDDERYAHLVGKFVRLPLVGREIPIFADTHVDPAFGTGCVKVTPAHDPNDFEMGRAHDLAFIVVMDKTAHMNENVPERFRGLYRDQCRKQVVAAMEELGLLEKVQDHTVAVGLCYRTGDVIEPYLSEQWFIKMQGLAEAALAPVAEGRIRLHPERWVKTYNHWLTNIKDWCISRQLRWGHRIPVWYCDTCGGQTCEIDPPAVCANCGGGEIRQDPDVLDTWASSWLWPFSVFGWPEGGADLAYFYPTRTLVTGPDIIFFWVARMIMAGLEFMGEIPFEDVYFNGIVRDLDGRKMSKTLGNSPDPLDVMENYGADALRFTIIYNTPYGQDTRFAKESCDLGRGFCTKIWNATRFLDMSFEQVVPDPDWPLQDQDIVGKWILSRLARTASAVTEDLDQFRVAAAASRIYNFFWGEFCDWYVEFLKPAVRQADAAETARLFGRTLFVVEHCLKLLHPFMPFVTEELWHHLRPRQPGTFLLRQDWPKVEASWVDEEVDQTVAILQDLISGVRAARKSYNLPHSAKFRLHLFADENQRRHIDEAAAMLESLASLEQYAFLTEDTPPEGCTAIGIKGVSAYLDLRGHLDVAAELAKIDGQLAKINKEADALASRLNNPHFAVRAPAPVVEKARGEYEDLQRQAEALAQTRADLEKLGA